MMSRNGTLLPRANAAACLQLAKADFASSSQHVRRGQRIANLEAKIDARQRRATVRIPAVGFARSEDHGLAASAPQRVSVKALQLLHLRVPEARLGLGRDLILLG